MADTSVLDKPADATPTPTHGPGQTPAEGDKTPPAAEPTSILDKPPAAPDGKAGDKPAPADGTKPAADAQKPPTQGAPEKYADPKLPESVSLMPEFKEKFDTLAKELGLSQESYQKVVDLEMQFHETQIKQTMDTFNKQISDWETQTKTELGAKFDETRAFAGKAIDAIFTDEKENQEFRTMMKDTGIGNWNKMVKAFAWIGRQISEDKVVTGKPGGQAEEKTLAQRMHPDLPSNPNAF